MTSFVRKRPTLCRVVLCSAAIYPPLVVTRHTLDGLFFGICATAALLFSNSFISFLRGRLPAWISVSIFILSLATFVATIDLLVYALCAEFYDSMRRFIPMIVVSSFILGWGGWFALRHGVQTALADALKMGFGFALSLTALGAAREILTTGAIFGKTFS